MKTLAELFENLSGDSWRITHPFKDDMLQANALLHNTAATEGEMGECLRLWCQRRQTCQFGRVAASEDRIHFCLLREKAVSTWTDEEIEEKIKAEKKLWKQRAMSEPNRAAHSFVIVVASTHVAFAAPDKHLRAFSDRVLELAGWGPQKRGASLQNSITSDYLYLKHPSQDTYFGFRFNTDFFACAGDGRWWQDHRFPGGIAFTANSTGHMIAAKEWYQGKSETRAWALKQAMLTIDNAACTRETDKLDPRTQGRVTWLRELDIHQRPMIQDIGCPLTAIPKSLEGKDWTRYEGLLHTDHAVREEFFFDREVAPTESKPYLMDLTYLYESAQEDFTEFTGGRAITVDQVFAELGRPDEWTHRTHGADVARSITDVRAVAEQLQSCRHWETISVADGLNS